MELKALPIAIHEAALYRDRSSISTSLSQSSHLWDLLTSTRDVLEYALSIPSQAANEFPSLFYHIIMYALIVMSMVVRLPSGDGWDNAIAKREADVVAFGLRAKEKFGKELTKTKPDLSIDEKDIWQYFSSGLGALVAWHQRCELQLKRGVEFDLPINSSCGNTTLHCAVVDGMTPFAPLKVPPTPP